MEDSGPIWSMEEATKYFRPLFNVEGKGLSAAGEWFAESAMQGPE
jgi:hypothetical protein